MRCKGKPKAHLQIRRVGHPEEKPKSRQDAGGTKDEIVRKWGVRLRRAAPMRGKGQPQEGHSGEWRSRAERKSTG